MDESGDCAQLVVEIARLDRRFAVSPNGICRIGRSPDNEIVIDHHLVSRNHAAVRGSTGRFLIFDLGSRNGTLVNGRRLQGPELLRNDDRITIGGIEIVFQQEQQDYTPEAGLGVLESTNVALAPCLVTVLVVDIRDSTVLARKLEINQLSQVMSALFRDAGKILGASGAWAQKYIGDAVMAVWIHKEIGGDLSPEMFAIVDGILQLVEIADGLQRRFGLSTPIRVGAGLNSGLASVGNVGSPAVVDFTAMGEVVHRAFRLESATKTVGYDLLVSSNSLDFLRKAGYIERMFHTCSVPLKGYDEPVTAFGVTFAELRSLERIVLPEAALERRASRRWPGLETE